MIIRPDKWVSVPDESGCGILEATVYGESAALPIPIETQDILSEDITFGEEQDFELIFECADTPNVYPNEEEYENSDEHSAMAAESIIPAGLFSASGSEGFVPSPQIIMSGRVTKTYSDAVRYGFDEDDVLFSISCLGGEYDAVLHPEFADGAEIKIGCIVSCIYWAQGWPKED